MNETTLKNEFEKLYLDIGTILPDKVLEHVHEHYYPHADPCEPLTPETLDAIREIHANYVAAVATVVGCSADEMAKTLDRIHREGGEQ